MGLWFLPWFIWAVVGPISAYYWGHAVGGERMRHALLSHPSRRPSRDTRKQIDQVA